MFKPLEGPISLLSVGLLLGIGNHLLLCALVQVDEERTIQLPFTGLEIL